MYKARESFELVNDAKLNIDPAEMTLPNMGRAAAVTWDQWVQLGGVFGIGATGVGLIVLAVLDPEPTSKLGLMVGAGALLAATGAFGGIYVLTGLKPSRVEVKREGVFVINF